MDRSKIDKLAQNGDDRVLLAKVCDTVDTAFRRNRFACTGFLSEREQALVRQLIPASEGLCFFGGYADAVRKLLCCLPDYMDEIVLQSEDSPIVCAHAEFYRGDTLTHRDILGALMGAGVVRAAVGDILVGTGCADFFLTASVAPFILQNLDYAGRTALHLSAVPLSQVRLAPPKTEEITDTVPSARLDCIVSAGFRVSRGTASDYIAAGKAAVDGLPCEKPDRPVQAGQTVSVRGMGKIRLTALGGETKKGRIRVTICRYV